MSLFSSKKTTSTTNYSTTNNLLDQSSNAAEGAVAVGAGANVNIVSSDAETVSAALAANQNVSLGSLAANQNVSLGSLAANQNVSQAAISSVERSADLSVAAQLENSRAALDSNRAIADRSLASNEAISAFAINSVVGLADSEAREREDILTKNLTAQDTQTKRLAQLASAALERSQTPDSQVTKTLLYVVGAAVLLFGLAALRRRPSSS